MQTALHSASTSHQGSSLVPLVPGTGVTLPDAISRSAKLHSSAAQGKQAHTGSKEDSPFTHPV